MMMVICVAEFRRLSLSSMLKFRDILKSLEL